MARTILRDHQGERYNFQWRLLIALATVLLAFVLLFSRFVYLQVAQHEKYHTLAESNRITLVPIPPPRGVIMDRNGVVLARNHSAYTLEITPSRLTQSLDATVAALGQYVEIQPKDVRRFKKQLEESKNFESLPIRNRLTDEEVARFAAQAFRFPGVEIKARLFRDYPMGESASHMIGYIGRITDDDLDKLDDEGLTANYKGTDHMGKFGLEQSYETVLHGKTGYEEVETDVNGRAIRSLKRTPPVSGDNLVLSVDIKLQQLAEQAFGENRGALVAIDPSTGGVLAMVSRPGFDPNLFVDGIDPQSWKELNESPDHPLNNRAIQGAYAPGSTFKPFMALAALETGKRTPQWGMHDPAYFQLGSFRWHDDNKSGHGWVDMYRSIVISCDTYYYQLANDMGIDAISNFMAPFGFGQQSGIDLPGEKRGVLPSQEWKRRTFKKPGAGKWVAGDTVSIGIGQGFNTYTPMQMSQALATLLNNGDVHKPHLVHYIENSATGVRTSVADQVTSHIKLKQENIDFVKNAMVGVNREGTGAAAFRNAGYVSGGKTGTAQVFSLKGAKYNAGHLAAHLKDNAWFIAFAPADHPKIAVALIVENGGWGASSAAPIARKVLDFYLLGQKPPSGSPTASDAAKTVPDSDEEETDETATQADVPQPER